MGRAKIKAPDTLFLPCQARWINDKSRLKIAEKSRQIGFTWTSSYSDVLTTAHVNNPWDLWITSLDELQAKLYIKDCLAWADIYNVAAKDLGCQIYQDASGRKHASFEVVFANGKIIHSLSSRGDAQAGKRGYRRADEFAINPQNRHLYDIMYPGATWGGTIWLWSTHRGSQNFFNLLIQEIREGGNPKGFSLHRITLQDALDEGFLDKLQQKLPEDDARQEMDEAEYFDSVRAGCSSEEIFLQEFMCVPSDDATAYISYDLIDQCTYPAGTTWEAELDPAGEYYLGMDIGRTIDLTVLYVIERVGDMRLTRRIIEMANTPFSEQERVLHTYAIMPCVKRICIDASGIGRQLAEQARQRYGHKVEEVVFTSGVKEDLATTTRRAMEDSRLRLPRSESLIADLRSIRKETTSAGNVRYVGERTTNGHADRFWALSLALMAAKSYRTSYMPVPLARPITGFKSGYYC